MYSDPSVLMGLEGSGLGRFGEPHVTYGEIIPKPLSLQLPRQERKECSPGWGGGISEDRSCQVSSIYLGIAGSVTRRIDHSEK